MKVTVEDHYGNKKHSYSGNLHTIIQKLKYDFPWTVKCYTLPEVITKIDKCQAYSAYKEEEDTGIAKSDESYVIKDMHGFQPEFSEEFEAARLLAGLPRCSHATARRALYEEEVNISKAALRAYGLNVTEDNLAALKSIQNMSGLDKSEDHNFLTTDIPQVDAVTESGKRFADMVKEAYKAGEVEHVNLDGKHSQGSMIATDDKTRKRFLLKPGSGPQSPADGASQDLASQSAREAAFWHVADAWGVGHWYPESELINIGGKDYSVQRLLAFNFASIDRRGKTDPAWLRRIFSKPLSDGDLLKWSVMDYVCGNPDCHDQNIMADEDGNLQLIDHGSAFAGSEFNPGHDRNSFVPGYLRAWAPPNFHKLRDVEKLKFMPTSNKQISDQVADWVLQLEPQKLAHILQEYQVDPSASLERLEAVRSAASNRDKLFSDSMNRLWVS